MPPSPSEPEAELAELPRELGEQMLQAILTSQRRLLQTTEALAAIVSAVAHAELALRNPGSPPKPHPRARVSDGGLFEILDAAFSSALHSANIRGHDGGYLFSSLSGPGAPFALDGHFQGSAAPGEHIIVTGSPPALSVAAAALTAAASGPGAIDVLGILARARAACSGEPSTREACRAGLEAAAAQLAELQAKLALALSVLADANGVTESTLAMSRPAAVDGDGGRRAGLLAQTFGAIEAARSLAERTLAIFPSLA